MYENTSWGGPKQMVARLSHSTNKIVSQDPLAYAPRYTYGYLVQMMVIKRHNTCNRQGDAPFKDR